MMQTVPATFVTSANKAGSVRITFEIEDEIRDTVPLLINSKMGKQWLVVAYEIGEEEQDIQQAFQDPNFAKNNFLKQVHAIIGEYSMSTGVTEKEIKKILKSTLKRRGQLTESMAELDEHGLAIAVHVLRTALHPGTFNYSEYLLKS